MVPVLGYWKIRGLAQHIRLLLEYLGLEYEDNIYTPGPAPDFLEKSDWKPVKYTIGLDFPNIPYYIDGDLKMTHNTAIMYHLGRKHNMVGKTEHEKIQVDMLVSQTFDLRIKFAMLVYGDYDAGKENYMKNLPDQLKLLADFLGSKTWFLGDQITIADFMIYEALETQFLLDPNCLKNTKNLDEFHTRFEELPAIKKYMASPRFIKAPMNGPSAKIGNK